MSKAVWGAALRLTTMIALGLACVSCGTVATKGTGSSFLIIKALEGASGAQPAQFGGTLSSDVLTIVKSSPTIFNDLGRASFILGLKDPGSAATPTAPAQPNWVTLERYHVRYIRSDGHNAEGVDVPYAFDDAVTATVTGEDTTVPFMLVRTQAKMEAPLSALAANSLVVSVIAEVTFYGHDQTGRTVSVVGNIGISFANFGDPA
jgi:hypothetical protein